MTSNKYNNRLHRAGFTLVEVLTVITIIAILAALLVPAVTWAVARGKTGAMRMEVENVSQAIEAYRAQYGDYPPDFSDFALVTRHYRQIFPNIQVSELTALSTATSAGRTMDRGEALVWALGGFSSDPEFPFSGAGGPLTVDSSNVVTSYNTDRDNSFFEFDNDKLGLSQSATGVVTAGTDGDFFPSYSRQPGHAPFVYFDSRTYAQPVDTNGDNAFDDYNGFNAADPTDDVNGVRPYISNEISTSGMKFANADSFQVLAPGLDGVYGTNYRSALSGDTRTAYYFQFPTGAMISITKDFSDASAPTVSAVANSNGYQEASYGPAAGQVVDNFQLDNISNFTESTLGDAVVE